MGPGDKHSLNTPLAASHPGVEALMGGTLALMTALVDPLPTCRFSVSEQRFVLARKVVANLSCLSEHAALSPGFRALLVEALQRWVEIAQLPAAVCDASAARGESRTGCAATRDGSAQDDVSERQHKSHCVGLVLH